MPLIIIDNFASDSEADSQTVCAEPFYAPSIVLNCGLAAKTAKRLMHKIVNIHVHNIVQFPVYHQDLEW